MRHLDERDEACYLLAFLRFLQRLNSWMDSVVGRQPKTGLVLRAFILGARLLVKTRVNRPDLKDRISHVTLLGAVTHTKLCEIYCRIGWSRDLPQQ